MSILNRIKKFTAVSLLGLLIASSLSVAAYALSELSVNIAITGAGRYISILNEVGVEVTDAFSISDTVAFNSTTAQTVNIGLAADDGAIAVTNPTASAGAWTLSIGATATSTWVNDEETLAMDFNDADTGVDGVDADSVGGRLTIDMTSATVAGLGSSTTTGVTSPSDAQSFAQGTKDSITLMSGDETAAAASAWSITDIDFIQVVPAAQAAEDYILDLTLTLT